MVNTIKLIIDLPVVQLSPIQPAGHIHHPSVCRHVLGLQLGEQIQEQFFQNVLPYKLSVKIN